MHLCRSYTRSTLCLDHIFGQGGIALVRLILVHDSQLFPGKLSLIILIIHTVNGSRLLVVGIGGKPSRIGGRRNGPPELVALVCLAGFLFPEVVFVYGAGKEEIGEHAGEEEGTGVKFRLAAQARHQLELQGGKIIGTSRNVHLALQVVRRGFEGFCIEGHRIGTQGKGQFKHAGGIVAVQRSGGDQGAQVVVALGSCGLSLGPGGIEEVAVGGTLVGIVQLVGEQVRGVQTQEGGIVGLYKLGGGLGVLAGFGGDVQDEGRLDGIGLGIVGGIGLCHVRFPLTSSETHCKGCAQKG